MTVEYVGERIFRQETEIAEQVWVARSTLRNIYAEELDEAGYSLPVWSSRGRVEEYLRNARLIGPRYEPDAIPLDVFVGRWLSDRTMGISELQINPDGKTTRVLVLTAEEFALKKQHP